jgi:hypothetical protein
MITCTPTPIQPPPYDLPSPGRSDESSTCLIYTLDLDQDLVNKVNKKTIYASPLSTPLFYPTKQQKNKTKSSENAVHLDDDKPRCMEFEVDLG